MMKRWWKLRSTRKFFSNRMAVVALFIVAIYLAIAVGTSLFGVIDLNDTFARVGPKNVSGFFQEQEPEKQVEDCEYLLNRVDRALGRQDPAQALAEIKLGAMHLKDLPPDEMKALLDQAWNTYDRLMERDDLNASPSASSEIDQLQRETDSLFVPLVGTRLWKHRFDLLLGTDAQGRSISLRSLYSIEVAIKIGLVVAFFSVLIGALLGAAAGFYGGWVDHLVTWIFTTFSSIPSLVLLVLLAYMFTGSVFEGTLVPMYIAFSATYWIGPCRVIRGETLKLRELEYVQAATVLGYSRPYIMVRHILPNASHLMLINFSLLFIAAIKGEVILTYLGLGIKNGTSWGIMIEQSRPEVINGFFWQIGSATILMFGLVLAFNVLSDALQDAFDPKHV
ncbi:MAG: ABC transporter permease [Pirellulaceae bacterium]|nr:ABC transporter permease [Pirellulaceae bacterium]